MIGHSVAQDTTAPPKDPRVPFLYRQEMSIPYSLLPQNLRASNKPSETNVVNLLPVIVVAQYPAQMQSGLTQRIISRHTSLPVGHQNQATFGSE